MGQVVDTETAKEFMKETLEKVAPEELAAICSEVEKKSDRFAAVLDENAIGDLTEEVYSSLMKSIFSVRRNKALLEKFAVSDLMGWTVDLLHGSANPADRFQTFVDRLGALPVNVRCDFASELLHFSQPDRYWLWTRWIWDPRTKTGALPLVTMSEFDLTGETESQIYLKVGEATAFVHQVGEAAGYQTINKNIFGTDVYLCCVYVVYVYTVLRMRMTQEFNKVIPGLPEFSRRLLGIHERKPRTTASKES